MIHQVAIMVRKPVLFFPLSSTGQLSSQKFLCNIVGYNDGILLRAFSAPIIRRYNRSEQQQLHRCYGTSSCLASPETATSTTTQKPGVVNSSTSTQQHAPFQYTKAEELFHRIIARCETIEDARALQRTVYVLLGKPLREFEFYIDGFGGKRSKHGSGSGKQEEAAEPVKEVQKIFDVKLIGYDASIKLKIIKEIRAILPGLGLKEAKELVESAPCTIQKGLQPEQAELMKQKLSDIGAQMELV
jgi:large subunit ribosomal protein L7/L12